VGGLKFLWGKFSFQVKKKTRPSFFEKRVIIFSFPKKKKDEEKCALENQFLLLTKKN